MKIKIIADLGEIVAIDKPAGWLSIPGRGNKSEVPIVSRVLGEMLRGSETRTSNDLFIVHRLDEGTSGVMLFARTATAHAYLSKAFETREIGKTYWCVVVGIPKSQIVDAPLFKLPSKKNKSVVDEKGKPSQTQISVLASSRGYSLVEAKPLTGRSHQIRVHLSHLGFPLLGDSLYGGQKKLFDLELAYPLLHSRGVEFQWPPGETKSVTTDVEGVFLEATKQLGLTLPG